MWRRARAGEAVHSRLRVLALVTAGIVAAGACAPRSKPAGAPTPTTDPCPAWTPPTEGGFAGHGTVYDDMDELVRKSDLIVIGTVEESVVGEVSDDDPECPTRNVHTTVSVEDALKGSAPEGDVIVPTLELAFIGNEEDWRVPGHRVLLFLTPSRERDEPFYILSNVNYLQTTYFVDGDEIEPGVEPHTDITGLSERVAKMTVPELREFVDASA